MRPCLPVFALLFACSLSAQEIQNPGFELDLTDWVTRSDMGMSAVVKEAARTGEYGLRVTDENDKKGSGLFSLPVEAVPETKYELSCWARGVSGEGGVGVYLRFLNEKGKLVKKEKYVSIPSANREWKRYSVSDTAPENAVSVEVWIHSFSADTPVVDLDDFELKALPAE